MLVEELQALKEFFLFFGASESLSTSRPRVRASPVSHGRRIPLCCGGYYYLTRTYCYQFNAFYIDDSVKTIKIYKN